MSRTFRLRHDPAGKARKYQDGYFTLHIQERESRMRDFIVHGIYGQPCLDEGKPLIVYYRASYGWMEVAWHGHYTCWWVFFKNIRIDSNALLEKYYGQHIYDVASMPYHPYANPGRRTRNGARDIHNNNWHERKGARKAMSMKMRELFVSGDDGSF